MSTPKPLPSKLQSEIGILRQTYSSEISTHRPSNTDLMHVEYAAVFKTYKIKIIFKFDINNIPSTINISINNALKKGGKIPAMAADFIISMLKDKFNSINNMPIYSTIQYFDREFGLKNSKSSPLKSTKEKRVVTQMKEQKERELNPKIRASKPKHGKEYVVFLRFNRLLEGSHQKKENMLLDELKKLTNSSSNFFAYLFFGTPGIICIRSTSKTIKTFTKKCNEVGKKAVISYFMEKFVIKQYIAPHTVETSRNVDNYNRSLIAFLDRFKLDDKLKTLDRILSGNQTKKHQKHKKKQTGSKDMYIADSKYEFNIEIGIIHRWNTMAPNKGNLHITILGENDSKLINKYKFSFQKWRNASLKFEFSSIDFLKNIGNLNKVYLENFSKESWQCDWVKISIYQISKKNKNAPILKKEYEAKQLKRWIRSNSSFSVNLSSKN